MNKSFITDRHNLAQRKFLLEGLICLKNNLSRLDVPLLVVKANNNQKATEIIVKLSDAACEVVTDAAYLREDRNFDETLNDKLVMKCRRFTKVEGNVTVPVAVNIYLFHFIYIISIFLCKNTVDDLLKFSSLLISVSLRII